MHIRTCLAALACALLVGCAHTTPAPLSLPFDFSKGEIVLDVAVKRQPLRMLLDTGVDPSTIDIARAEALGLSIDRANGGEASGAGNDAHASVYPTTISGLALSARAFAPVEALAMNMAGLSQNFGEPLDGVLGYSFLKDKVALIDYSASRVSIFASAAHAEAQAPRCRDVYAIPYRSFTGDTIPVIADFRLGDAAAPISLDTGANSGIALYQGALDLPGVRAALTPRGEAAYAGARGRASAQTYVLNAPVGFGPFTLPAGQIVSVREEPGSAETRLANVGNAVFSAMGLKILLDYPGARITFYGGCEAS